MNLQQAKESILQECDREKKIVVRNLIIVVILIIIAIALLIKYLLPQITEFFNNATTEINNNKNFGTYIKIAIAFGILTSLFYPISNVIKVLKRKEKIEKAFGLLQSGETAEIYGEEEKYLTIIPLLKIKINLDPITYIGISIGNKSFDLPASQIDIPYIKRALNNIDVEVYNTIINAIYGENNSPTENATPTTLKSVQEFQQFADKEFTNDIATMEKGRSKTTSMFYIQLVAVIGFMAIVVWFISRPKIIQNSADVFKIIGGFIGFALILSYVFYFINRKNGAKGMSYTEFKKSIFTRLIRYINPSFQYIEKSHVGLPEFLHSGLFEQKNYKITGSDQIIGYYNSVPFQSCTLFATYRQNLRNEKDPDDTVFYGNFFVARFPKKIAHSVFIHPKKGVFGSMKDNEIGTYLNTTGQNIRLEDPEFQKQFNVFCDDQVTARYVLTPSFMERIKAINTRNKGNVYVSINENNIVIATNQSNATNTGDGIYGMMFTKIDMKLVNEIYTELTEQLSMIDTLKLNNEIWKN